MKTLQNRHVPEHLHRTLKARAARAGLTLSAYVLAELETSARRPTTDELFDRIRDRGAMHGRASTANAVRAERGRPRGEVQRGDDDDHARST